MRKIILASQSPQRRILMTALGVAFEAIPADIDEKSIVEEDQILRAKYIAKAKAEEVLNSHPEAIVIAADTFTVFNGKAYEKPENIDEAIKMLEEHSGKTGVCYTGFAYVDKVNSIEFFETVETEILVRKILSSEIQKYVAENPVTTWSAGFSPAYPEGANFIASINGSYTSFSHGLPIELVVPNLEKSGVFDEAN